MIEQKDMANEDTSASDANVILDTNFFVDMFRFKISFTDIEDVVGQACNFWIVVQTVDELKKMRAKEAKVALEFIKRVETLKTRGKTADEAIISVVKQNQSQNQGQDQKQKFIVATNDAKLRKQIKALGARVIYLRARKHLEIS